MRLGGRGNDAAVRIDDYGASAAGADIDSENVPHPTHLGCLRRMASSGEPTGAGFMSTR